MGWLVDHNRRTPVSVLIVADGGVRNHTHWWWGEYWWGEYSSGRRLLRLLVTTSWLHTTREEAEREIALAVLCRESEP